jgi:hypothetical protein
VVDEDQIYAVVAARRLQWDALVWQVPVLSLTAQAFLFTIALGPDTDRGPRALSALLSLVITFLSVELMSRHRQAEIMDACWLEARELEAWPEDGVDTYVVHGLAYREKRQAIPVGPLGRFPGYWTWLGGLSLFGLAALVVLVATVADAAWLR